MSDESYYLAERVAAIERLLGQTDREQLLERLSQGSAPDRLGFGSLPRMVAGQSPTYETLGNTQPFVGSVNILRDPTWEMMSQPGYMVNPGGLLGTSETTWGFWSGHYVLNSGSLPTEIRWEYKARRYDAAPGPGSGQPTGLALTFAAGACNLDVFIYPASADDFSPGTSPTLPFLVAGVRAWKNAARPARIATEYITMQILEDGVVVAESDPWDMVAAALYDYKVLYAATQQDDATWRAHSWRWRLKYHVEVTAGTAVQAGTRWIEPQMHFAYTPDLMGFQPAVASWKQGVIPANFVLTRAQNVTLTGDYNDLDVLGVPGISQLKMTPTVALTITGLKYGTAGAVLILLNENGTYPITLAHDSASSAADNRFYTPNGSSYIIPPYGAAWVMWDDNVERWRIIGPPASSAETILTPSTFGVDQNDYNPTGLASATWLRLQPTSAVNLTGITAPSSAKRILVTNIASFNLTLKNENAGSTAANRIIAWTATNVGESADRTIYPGNTVGLAYDTVSQRWRTID